MSAIRTAAAWLGAAGLAASSFGASPRWLTAHDAEIKALVGRMTLAEKAGQMTQPNFGQIRDLTDISRYGFGSVLNGGSTDPKTGNRRSDWAGMVLACEEQAQHSRLHLPLLYGVDAVHGHNNVLGAVIFPHNIGLGCTRDPELVEAIGRITAEEVRATGIQWAFGPCLAVPQDARWGRTYEGYAEDPGVVAWLGAASVRGLQGVDLSGPAAVLACAKHAVGDGGTTFVLNAAGPSIDQGDTRVDEATLRRVHLAGYPAAIDAGVGTIMASYSSWNGQKCSGNRYLLTEVLKRELGFEGFIVSDYNAIDQLVPAAEGNAAVESNNASGQVRTANYKRCVEWSINAGIDMVMLTSRYEEFIDDVVALVREGRIPLARIDDAVTRILRVKSAMGLLDPAYAPRIDDALGRGFGSAAHRAVARRAVRESLVLLKNDRGVLPLSAGAKRIHVTGRGADDLGMQCGGWTIDWQGQTGEVTPGGTTILAAIRQAVDPATAITSSRDGSGAAGASAAVVVVGEAPYAESKGDRADLSLSAEDQAAVARAKAAGVPVVLVVLSGRPLILGSAAEQADAIVAAWLPGTEGAGIADVLFGRSVPTGRLSFHWPRSMAGVPAGAAGEPPLYPFGFGLSYP